MVLGAIGALVLHVLAVGQGRCPETFIDERMNVLFSCEVYESELFAPIANSGAEDIFYEASVRAIDKKSTSLTAVFPSLLSPNDILPDLEVLFGFVSQLERSQCRKWENAQGSLICSASAIDAFCSSAIFRVAIAEIGRTLRSAQIPPVRRYVVEGCFPGASLSTRESPFVVIIVGPGTMEEMFSSVVLQYVYCLDSANVGDVFDAVRDAVIQRSIMYVWSITESLVQSAADMGMESLGIRANGERICSELSDICDQFVRGSMTQIELLQILDDDALEQRVLTALGMR